MIKQIFSKKIKKLYNIQDKENWFKENADLLVDEDTLEKKMTKYVSINMPNNHGKGNINQNP